ncbi:MAG: hypothetical protein AAFR38_02955 [Planctomycetota bacterium]
MSTTDAGSSRRRRPPKPKRKALRVDEVYRRSAAGGFRARNPLIVIHGILGARLVVGAGGRSVWGDFRKGRLVRPDAEGVRQVALPMRLGAPLEELRGVARPDGTLGQVSGTLAGIPIRPRIYGNVMQALGVASYSDTHARGSLLGRHETAHDSVAFEFNYDWRRSLDESAGELLRFIRRATKIVQATRGTTGRIKFDIVAHSMGGMLIRYFLRHGDRLLSYADTPPRPTWAGAKYVERVVIAATPNAGSLFALDRLVAGLPGTPITPRYSPEVLGTMPAVYQLLPRTRYTPVVDGRGRGLDVYDASVWHDMGWGLAGVGDVSLGQLLPGLASEAERRETAGEHLEKCLRSAAALHRSLDTPERPPETLQFDYFLSDSLTTPRTARAVPGQPFVEPVEYGPGDRTVLRTSVLLDEREDGDWTGRLRTPLSWRSLTFLTGTHQGVLQHPAFLDRVLFLLLDAPPPGGNGPPVVCGGATRTRASRV